MNRRPFDWATACPQDFSCRSWPALVGGGRGMVMSRVDHAAMHRPRGFLASELIRETARKYGLDLESSCK